MGETNNAAKAFRGQSRAARACLLVGAVWVATANAAPSAEPSDAVASPKQSSKQSSPAAEAPLLTVAPDNAFACAQTLKDGVVSTHAFINYVYTDAREAAAAAGKTPASGPLGRQRIGQASVCRIWHGPLRAMEISALLQSLAVQHPEQRDVVVKGVAGQD